MKNFKQIAFGLMIGALAIGFSAFTNAKNVNKAKFADQWFQLKSTVTPSQANALISSNYDAPMDTPPCPGTVTYCGVQANNVSGHPDLGSSTPANAQIVDFFSNNNQGSRISAEGN
jgi:hypothetical protein